MTAGTLVFFATLSEKVVASLYRLGRLYSHLGDSMEAIRQFTELFQEESDIVDLPDAMPCSRLEGKLEFSNVSFSYNAGKNALSGVNLVIQPRRVLALVGRSGSGKTTIAKLICRHYDVTAGAILADGTDIRKFKIADYRRQIAVVSQDIEIFDADLWSNIAYGIDATKEQIQEAARVANAEEFIRALPDGYDTRVGERGVKLSGGQRQRVGIARALIMKPAVMIFDEATSSLDTESERLIQDSLRKIMREQTMIIIAHRFSTLEFADMVVVLEDGRIIESGPPRELLHSEGVFARMRKLQELGEIRP
jgi:ABC-type multidrug transport system fused ATPase/permease subunit